MPGHIKLGKPGTPDEDPTSYLVIICYLNLRNTRVYYTNQFIQKETVQAGVLLREKGLLCFSNIWPEILLPILN